MTITILRQVEPDEHGKRVEVSCDGPSKNCKGTYVVYEKSLRRQKTGYCKPCSYTVRPKRPKPGKFDPNMLGKLWRLA